MSHINYQSLRGKVFAYAPAEPAGNPHLWVVLEAEGQKYFATINVRSNKDAPGDPIGKSYLYYFIDADYDHPIVPAILERPQGMSQVERSYPGGALDFQRGALFNPNAMRVLPMEGPGDDGLVHRLTANLQLAKQQDCEVILYGNAFAKDNPHQTDAAFGFTPDTPFGLDNVHMAQGDPRQIDARLHENGVWHDGADFHLGRARKEDDRDLPRLPGPRLAHRRIRRPHSWRDRLRAAQLRLFGRDGEDYPSAAARRRNHLGA